jgi:hypothetical protein
MSYELPTAPYETNPKQERVHQLELEAARHRTMVRVAVFFLLLLAGGLALVVISYGSACGVMYVACSNECRGDCQRIETRGGIMHVDPNEPCVESCSNRCGARLLTPWAQDIH